MEYSTLWIPVSASSLQWEIRPKALIAGRVAEERFQSAKLSGDDKAAEAEGGRTLEDDGSMVTSSGKASLVAHIVIDHWFAISPLPLRLCSWLRSPVSLCFPFYRPLPRFTVFPEVACVVVLGCTESTAYSRFSSPLSVCRTLLVTGFGAYFAGFLGLVFAAVCLDCSSPGRPQSHSVGVEVFRLVFIWAFASTFVRVSLDWHNKAAHC